MATTFYRATTIPMTIPRSFHTQFCTKLLCFLIFLGMQGSGLYHKNGGQSTKIWGGSFIEVPRPATTIPRTKHQCPVPVPFLCPIPLTPNPPPLLPNPTHPHTPNPNPTPPFPPIPFPSTHHHSRFPLPPGYVMNKP